MMEIPGVQKSCCYMFLVWPGSQHLFGRSSIMVAKTINKRLEDFLSPAKHHGVGLSFAYVLT